MSVLRRGEERRHLRAPGAEAFKKDIKAAAEVHLQCLAYFSGKVVSRPMVCTYLYG
jgi:hypothetical protein